MVNKSLCRQCYYMSTFFNGNKKIDNNIVCNYLLDTGKLPRGYYTADGTWRRTSCGNKCFEFIKGEHPKRINCELPLQSEMDSHKPFRQLGN